MAAITSSDLLFILSFFHLYRRWKHTGNKTKEPFRSFELRSRTQSWTTAGRLKDSPWNPLAQWNRKKKMRQKKGGEGEDRLVGAASCESWTPFRVAGSNPFCMGLIINAHSRGQNPAFAGWLSPSTVSALEQSHHVWECEHVQWRFGTAAEWKHLYRRWKWVSV